MEFILVFFPDIKGYQSIDVSAVAECDVYSHCHLLDASLIKSLQRFGHKICHLDFNSTSSSSNNGTFIAVTGGFGLLSDSRHRRLSDITVFHMADDANKNISLISSVQLDTPRLFHAAIAFGGNKMALFGGRLSPLKHFDDIIVVTFNLELADATNKLTTNDDFSMKSASSPITYKVDINWEKIAYNGDPPSPRWRHSATTIGIAFRLCLN